MTNLSVSPRTTVTPAQLLSEQVRRILSAPVYDLAIETPLQRAPALSATLGNQVLLKREDLQPTFSFKIRGAYTRLSRLTPAQRERGVITASAGNHAQGVALAASHLGMRATIVMPTTTPELKVQGVRSRGGMSCCTVKVSPMRWPMPCNWPTATVRPSCRRSTTRT